MTVTIVPAPEAGWPAVETVMLADATSRDCWCQFRVLANADYRRGDRVSRRQELESQIATLNPPRGLIALDGDEPVGWVGVEPRLRLPHLLRSRLVTKESPFDLDDAGVWSIYCVLVLGRRRGQGVAATLVGAAVAHAREQGATGLEAYPIDVSARGGRLPSGIATGTVSMFTPHGFEAVAALPSARTLMVRRAP